MKTIAIISALIACVAFLARPQVAESSVDHDDKEVTCGSAVKLTHYETGDKYFLHSANQNMGSGSGQQVVTLIPNKGKQGSLWLIREGDDQPDCSPGEPIECGQRIRLTHLHTQKNLHTHLIRSPLSRQQEVSGYGEGGEGDSGDDWIVVCGSGAKYLKRGTKFRLQHVDTKRYLSATEQVKFTEQNCGGNCPILHHLEVAARSSPDRNTEFKIDLGVHLSK
uniref:MIR domain-containing protein n=1 Tax=Pseudictyota dubia TaxID=2749911 RepID=A0A7R9W406_9STRA